VTINAARACGASQNENCPAYITSIHSHGGSAALGNDGSTTNTVRSLHNYENWFRIDFQQTRHLKTVRFYNRNDCCRDRSIDGRIAVSDSTSNWLSAQCATLDAAHVQNFNCQLSGQYIFLYQNNGQQMNFAELEAYATTCPACPSHSTAPPGSNAVDACECNAGYIRANGGTCSICAPETFKVGLNP